VLHPYTGETWRKSGDRVAGTVAGAILAAILAAAIPSDTAIIATVSIGCVFSLAVYAVDYAWYSFFLTPTIVPHLDTALTPRPNHTLADQQMTRIERQVAVLEQAAADIAST
jgi:uncharacterized membrane protein YccC